MNFRDIELEDGKWARPLLEYNRYKSCEYTFSNLFMWGKVFGTQIAENDEFAFIRSFGRRMHYLYPAGRGDMKDALEAIFQDAEENGKDPVIFSIEESAKKQMEELYPGKFVYTLPRGQSDYVYLSTDLATLPGKKFQKKRNHCSKFERTYPDWAFHEITPDAMEAVCEFNNRWCNLYDNRDDEGIASEHRAIQRVCKHYGEMNLKGGYITTGGEIVAFSFGSQLRDDMFNTHVEKALYDAPGAYNIINREMARHFCEGYTYINRENDLDEEGLRTAKLSYNPTLLVDKYTATLKEPKHNEGN